MNFESPSQQRAKQVVNNVYPALLNISHALSADPELGFNEHRSAALVAGLLEKAGFDVRLGAYDLPTAIEASYGSGEVTIAVAGEYDALPGVGHACGHNVIAASSLGAAIGLREVADELGFRVVFLGTPAEENGGGKVFMLERGAWDDVTFSLMLHPAGQGQATTATGSSQALDYFEVTFHGKPAHAAFAPHEGVNAGSAVTLAEVGIGLLRQHMPAGVIISSVSRTDSAVNVIPESAHMQLEVRANDTASWELVKTRVREVVAGAAMAAGCTYDLVVPSPGYAPLNQDPDLSTFFDAALAELRGESIADWADGTVLGSTDMGDVSQYLPAIHPMIALDGVAASPHQHEFAAAAASPAGDAAILNGALSLTAAAIAAVETPKVRERMLAAQRDRAPHARGHWTTAPIPE